MFPAWYNLLRYTCEVFYTPPLTFEYGADVFPDGDAAAVMELTESQFHVEERNTSKHCHQQVRQQKGTWAQQRTEQMVVLEELDEEVGKKYTVGEKKGG